MKILLLIFITFINYPIIIFSQFYVEKEISPCVIEFMDFADETAKYYDIKQGLQKSLSDEELNHITRLYFKIYNEDPVGLSKYIHIKHKEWEQKMKDSDRTIMQYRRPGFTEGILKKQIRKKYGGKFTEIISTPAFIRGKVISIGKQVRKTDVREPYDNLGTIAQRDLTVYIEEVLKGEKFFKKGTTITISYSLDWSMSSEYEVNKSYLFPLRPWLSLREYTGEITLQSLFYKGENYIPFEGPTGEIYPIENESVYSKEDFFDTGERTPWETFKEHFKNTYMILGE